MRSRIRNAETHETKVVWDKRGGKGVRGHPIHLPDGFHRSQDDVSALLGAVQNMLLVETLNFSGCCYVSKDYCNQTDDSANLIPLTVFNIVEIGCRTSESRFLEVRKFSEASV